MDKQQQFSTQPLSSQSQSQSQSQRQTQTITQINPQTNQPKSQSNLCPQPIPSLLSFAQAPSQTLANPFNNNHNNNKNKNISVEDSWLSVAKVSAPGKVILCGQHAVVYGEDALAMAIQLRCQAIIYYRYSKEATSTNVYLNPNPNANFNINGKKEQTQGCQYQYQHQYQHQCGNKFQSQKKQTDKNENNNKNLNKNSNENQYNDQLLFTGCLNFGISFSKIKQLRNLINLPQDLSEYIFTQRKNEQQQSFQQRQKQKQKQKQDLKQKYKIEYKLALFFKHIQQKQNKISVPSTQTNQSTKIYAQNNNFQQFRIHIQSQLPIGKCLGSSAAFNTVLATVFCVIFNFNNYQGINIAVDKENTDSKKQQNDNRFELSEQNLNEINKISKIFEKVQHGTPSGIDNFVSTYGGLVLYNNSKTPPFKSITDPVFFHKLNKQIRFKLIDSGVEKNTKKAVGIVRARCHEEGTSQQRHQCKDQCTLDQEMVRTIGTYARRVIELMTKNQLEGKDHPDSNHNEQWQEVLFSIMASNHALLNKLGVSIPEIQEIVVKNTVHGIRACKITGAGMGGYVLVAERVEAKEGSIENQIDKQATTKGESDVNKQFKETITQNTKNYINKQLSNINNRFESKEIITNMDQRGLIIQYL